MAEVADNSEKTISLSIPFSSTESASLVYQVLVVDKEIKGSKVRREITTDGVNILIKFYGAELKTLRVAVNSILKNLLLIVKTIEQFDKNHSV